MYLREINLKNIKSKLWSNKQKLIQTNMITE